LEVEKMPGWNGFCGFGYLGGAGWIINLVLSVVILVGLVLLVIWAVRRLANQPQGTLFSSGQGGSQSARDILQARYARGEISREQYQQMLDDIR
jgi:putative membrane protein